MSIGAGLADHDSIIRTVVRRDGAKVPLSLNSEALLSARVGAKRRLGALLPPSRVESALKETREIARGIARHVVGMPPDAAYLSALFSIANEDALPTLGRPELEVLRGYAAAYGEEAINELSAVCQLEDLPGFFAGAAKQSLQSYFESHLETDGPTNFLIRECILDLDAG